MRVGQGVDILTCRLGNGANQNRRDGHDDATDGRNVRQHLRPAGRFTGQHALEISLRANNTNRRPRVIIHSFIEIA